VSTPLNKRLLLINSGSGVIERFVNLFIQIWLYQYLIKRISPDEYSLFPVLTALMVFIPPLTSLLTSGIARYTVEADARGDGRRVTEITSTIFPVLLIAGAALAVLACVLAAYVGWIIRVPPERVSEARLMLLLLFGSVSLRLVLAPFGIGLYVRQKFVVSNALTLVQAVVRLTLLFALLLGAGPRVLWVVVATVVADVTILLVTTRLSVRALPCLTFRRDRIRWTLLRPLTSFGVWNVMGWLAHVIRTSAGLLILNRLGTPLNVASLHLASLPDYHIGEAVQKAMSPLQPPMVALHATGDHETLQRLHIRLGRYSLWAFLFVVTPLIAFRREFWSLYLGSAFETYGEVPLIMTLVLARYWAECPSHPTGMVAHAANRMRELSIMAVLLSLTNVAITLYLVGTLGMGAIGAGLGMLIASTIWHPLVMWGFGLKLVGLKFLRWSEAVLWRGALPSVVAGGFALVVRQWVQPYAFAELVAVTGAVAFVYLLIVFLFCLDADEHHLLRQIPRRLLSHAYGARDWIQRPASEANLK
jgi:O-antigen/teichoic acid export membrane protein